MKHPFQSTDVLAVHGVTYGVIRIIPECVLIGKRHYGQRISVGTLHKDRITKQDKIIMAHRGIEWVKLKS